MSNENKLSPEIMEEIPQSIKDKIEAKANTAEQYRLRFDVADAMEFLMYGYSLALTKQWVKVTDKEPEENKPYWIFGSVLRWTGGWSKKEVSFEPHYWDAKKQMWKHPNGKGHIISKITHYAPYTLPSPPQD